MAEHAYSISGPAFVLVPYNSDAQTVLDSNPDLHYRDGRGQVIGLDLDFNKTPIFKIGWTQRDTSTIYLPDSRSSNGPHIAALHASFQLIPDTGAVLLWDHTSTGSVETFSAQNSYAHTVKFRKNAPRSVIVANGINALVAFGDDRWYQFELRWRTPGMYEFDSDELYRLGPEDTRTKRYVAHRRLGGGSYGTVYKALDVTTGQWMAVKKFHNLSGKRLQFLTREVENLTKEELRTHPNILGIFDSVGGGEKDGWGEIFMPLKKGNLKDLFETIDDEQAQWDLSDIVLRQMLLALQCLEKNGIVHRDVKPENILWDTFEDGSYQFLLGDFGLSNDPDLAVTAAGTEPFMAPEIGYQQKQTTKVDIWSLFATVAWMRNAQFRGTCSRLRASELHKLIFEISKGPQYANIRRMASWLPKERPSAKRQLAMLDLEPVHDSDEEYNEASTYDNTGTRKEDAGDILSAQFQGMTLQPSWGPGSGSSEYPEVPYYEPYMNTVNWKGMSQGSPDDAFYQPPPAGSSDAPRGQGAWVSAYGQTYGPVESRDSDEGTTVPEMGTIQAAPVTEEESQFLYQQYLDERRRQKEQRRKGKDVETEVAAFSQTHWG